ncbi:MULTISPECIES: hypothetical protein [unclassified Leclercia]|uniref:Phage protein n=1 Tax=Leclercia barmai TaxID=2785629 RepID=A0ABS7RS33_9ENTR|nr:MULTISPECIES: hypothetical protein [unclassified Leclercia]MBZ0057135.1 hypothetical protein [Leclercia sp. EMC7]MCM5695310.1 hypothetical protein [Leclercia sp. LTM01]MCM5699717.1 hypothetical protein [Leclercia sp. LTM14]
MAKKLTKKEQAWIDELQAVLDRCPSPEKIGYYTIGDNNIFLYDLRRENEIQHALDSRAAGEWGTAAVYVGADFDETIDFPSAVLSTAG